MKKKKILIVDDAEELAQCLADMLEMEGYAVKTLNDPTKVIPHVTKDAPDLLIVDLVMPKMTGFEVIRQLRTIDVIKTLPVIAVSADASEERQNEGLSTGADAFLSKPFDEDLLLKKISSLLKK